MGSYCSKSKPLFLVQTLDSSRKHILLDNRHVLLLVLYLTPLQAISFQADASSLQRISHKNILKILDFSQQNAGNYTTIRALFQFTQSSLEDCKRIQPLTINQKLQIEEAVEEADSLLGPYGLSAYQYLSQQIRIDQTGRVKIPSRLMFQFPFRRKQVQFQGDQVKDDQFISRLLQRKQQNLFTYKQRKK